MKIVDVEVDHNYMYWCTSMSYYVLVKPPVLDWTIIIVGEVADVELDHNYVAVQSSVLTELDHNIVVVRSSMLTELDHNYVKSDEVIDVDNTGP